MSFIAILGAGPLGGAIAQRLAERDRIAEVRLIDPDGTIAQGKALDILQSAPISGFSTRVTASIAIEAAVGGAVAILADAASGHEHSGEDGLALLRRLLRAGLSTPIVCAGTAQRALIAAAVRELHVDRRHILGSAPYALESALRALTGLAIDGSAVEVGLRVVGVPPDAAFAAWEEASVSGQPASAEIQPHVIAGLTARIPTLWPPGPYALGSACARVAEAIARGSRRRFSCFVALDAGPVRTAVAAMPVELERTGIRRIVAPALTRQERTLLENAIEGDRTGPPA